MTDVAAWLRTAVEITCMTGPIEPDTLARRLGVDLVPGWLGYAQVDRPPEGIESILIGLDGVGGPVKFVEITLDEAVEVTQATLEAGWSNRRAYVPDHRGDPERWMYDVSMERHDRACRVAVDLRPPDSVTEGRVVFAITVIP